MKRISHGDYADFDFLLIGISSNADELKICWLMNRAFSLDLERQDDVEIKHLKSGLVSNFCNFIFEKKSIVQEVASFVNEGIAGKDFDESSVIYQLLGNRHPSGNLIPEQPRMDYFLLLAGEGIHEIDSASIVNELRKFNEIQAAFIIDVESLKSKNNLIF
jgi:hypothetical protein